MPGRPVEVKEHNVKSFNVVHEEVKTTIVVPKKHAKKELVLISEFVGNPDLKDPEGKASRASFTFYNPKRLMDDYRGILTKPQGLKVNAVNVNFKDKEVHELMLKLHNAVVNVKETGTIPENILSFIDKLDELGSSKHPSDYNEAIMKFLGK